MSLQAAIALDLDLQILADRADDGAALVARNVTLGSPGDPVAVAAFAGRCDVVTFDHELVPAAVLSWLDDDGRTLRPSRATMELAQNKRRQRELFAGARLPQPAFAVVSDPAKIGEFGERSGWPVVVKASTGGYDGRGVWTAEDVTTATQVATELLRRGIEPMLEAHVPIEREVAILVARDVAGETAVYPLVETVQREGICREVLAPAAVPTGVAHMAEELARQIAELSGVVGILAVELFVSGGELIVNEIATRPHNSGHYTIEGCVTSQFEQHLRAVAGWPLGETGLRDAAVVTINVLGPEDGSDPRERMAAALAVPGAHVHLYGKTARPGRKLGHVTTLDRDVARARARAARAVDILTGARDG